VPATQVSQNGGLARWVTGGGTDGVMGAVLGWMTGHLDGSESSRSASRFWLRYWFSGTTLIDILRMQFAADPTKYNVK
jgi:hypothetical protein